MPRGEGLGNDFEVSLFYTDGGKERLPELNVISRPPADDDCGEMDVWVESEVGRHYQIKIVDKHKPNRPAKQAIWATVEVDGRRYDEDSFALSRRTLTFKTITMNRDGKPSKYRLRFSEIDAVEDRSEADVCCDDAAEVGTIRIDLDRGYANTHRAEPDAEYDSDEEVVEELGTMYEGDSKAGQKTTGGVTAVKARHRQVDWVTTGNVDGLGPFYTFNIKYATRAIIDAVLGGHKPSSQRTPSAAKSGNGPLSAPGQASAPQLRPSQSSSPSVPKRSRSRSSDLPITDDGFSELDSDDHSSDNENSNTVELLNALLKELEDEKRRKAKRSAKRQKKAHAAGPNSRAKPTTTSSSGKKVQTITKVTTIPLIDMTMDSGDDGDDVVLVEPDRIIGRGATRKGEKAIKKE